MLEESAATSRAEVTVCDNGGRKRLAAGCLSLSWAGRCNIKPYASLEELAAALPGAAAQPASAITDKGQGSKKPLCDSVRKAEFDSASSDFTHW